MKVLTLATGSRGNAYVLTDNDNNQILIECGIQYNGICSHIDFERLDCVLVSHAHKDHNLCANKFEELFIDVYSPANCQPNKLIKLRNWDILPLEMYHNTTCYGFWIRNFTENKNILYATDTRALPKIADKHFDLMMLECNYNYDKMLENSQKELLDHDGYKNHMALEDLEEWLRTREKKPTHLMAIHTSNADNLDRNLATATLCKYATKFYIIDKGEIEI